MRIRYVSRLATVGVAFLMIVGPAAAQTEDDVRAALEGKEVRVLMDMPGSSHGVDVYPRRKPTVKFDEYTKEVKRYGVAIQKGATSRITRIKVRDKHIEIQLDGGGPSRLGGPNWVPELESPRETELAFKRDRSAEETRELEELRRQRRQEDDQSKQEHEQVVKERLATSGSRFNIRYDSKLTAAEITAEAVRAALQEYVQFDPRPIQTTSHPAVDPEGEKTTAPLVVMIKGVLDGDETIGAGIIVGTGNDRLYIATANHVVRRRASQIQQPRVLFKWLPGEWTSAKLLESSDGDLDLAVLSVENVKQLSMDHLAFDRVAEGAPRVQQQVYFVGHGGGEAWHTRRAPDAVSGVSGDTIRFQSAFLVPGDSGGALVSDGWRIIGMLQSDQAGEAKALSMRRILDKLQEWNYPVTLRASGS